MPPGLQFGPFRSQALRDGKVHYGRTVDRIGAKRMLLHGVISSRTTCSMSRPGSVLRSPPWSTRPAPVVESRHHEVFRPPQSGRARLLDLKCNVPASGSAIVAVPIPFAGKDHGKVPAR